MNESVLRTTLMVVIAELSSYLLISSYLFYLHGSPIVPCVSSIIGSLLFPLVFHLIASLRFSL